MAIKAILFDLDGTLIDSEILWIEAYTKVLESLGLISDREWVISQVHGKSFKDLYRHTLASHPSFHLSLRETEHQMREFFLRLTEERDIVIHSSVKKLKALAKDYFIAIVSGSARKDIFAAMDLMGIKTWVDYVVGAEDCHRGKPDPEGYLKAMRYRQLRPQECLVFEDSSAGIKAAKTAGMHCVALTVCNHFNNDVRGADLIVDDLNKVNMSQF